VSGNGVYTWSSAQMATDVQDWLDGTYSDYGWIAIGDEATTKSAKRFNSRENGTDPPALTVDFTPPPASGACCAGDGSCTVPGGSSECSAQGGSYQGDGSSCSPNPCPQPAGACCFADATATCTEVTEVSCTGSGGTFEGTLTSCTPNPCPVVLTPFVDALPIPPLAQPVTGSPGGAASYEMTMSEIQQQLHRDLANPTTVWGYDDGTNAAAHPGPTILATTGQAVQVTWKNDLRETGTGTLRTDHYLPVDTCAHGADDQSPRTVVHLHGGHVEEQYDGYPESTFLPGQQAVYQYPNNQQAATLWYHDHALGITRLNVIMGMAGFYLITDSVEQALDLPSGDYQIGLALQDRTFNPDGSFEYPAAWQDSFFGDTILVNGKVWPYLDVDQGKYRFRILGGSNSRHYTLSLSTGAPITVIGTEGGLLPAPVPLSEITIGPGERWEVIIDFAAYAPGTEVFLENSAPAPYPGDPGVGVIPDVMKFVVGSSAGHTNAIPASLRTNEILDELDAVEFRDFELQKGSDPCSGFKWLINGLGWDDITEYPVLGTTEVWRFINRSGMTHPMHMHLVFFQVLDRQNFEEVGGEVVPIGSPVPPSAEEAGWKDTVLVAPNEIVRVIARFEDYVGKYAYHCHILEHEDHEMMRQFQTVAPPPVPALSPWGLRLVTAMLMLALAGALFVRVEGRRARTR
jgi:spore coat protein A